MVEFITSLLSFMEVIRVKDKGLEIKTLVNACELNITYYDAAYLIVAEKFDKILVTDDEKLTAAAREIGMKHYPARAFSKSNISVRTLIFSEPSADRVHLSKITFLKKGR